ncbi:hypothetical protein COY27_05420 [Candidatus Woesearchaeota archaeon CG_4_10_14_0_2_um_filter_33_13]|nr:MAG: hypothetical protein COY27_05420 [Candidatus Woesearchaeota archaeon CG_4_10_14_0_2_um_filter_33_13]
MKVLKKIKGGKQIDNIKRSKDKLVNFNWRSLAIPVCLNLFITLILIGGFYILNSSFIFALSMGLLSLGISLQNSLTKTIGTGGVFFIFYSFLTFNLPEIGIAGWDKIVVFLISGILYECVQIIFKRREFIFSILAPILTITLIPFISALMISWKLVLTFPTELVDLVIFAGIVSCVCTLSFLLVWAKIKTNKKIIKLRSYFGVLNQ